MSAIRPLVIGQFIIGIILIISVGISSVNEYTIWEAIYRVYGAFIALDVTGIWVAYLLSKYWLYEDITLGAFLKDRW